MRESRTTSQLPSRVGRSWRGCGALPGSGTRTETYQSGSHLENQLAGYQDETVQCGWRCETYQSGARTEQRFARWRAETVQCGTQSECYVSGSETRKEFAGYVTETVQVGTRTERYQSGTTTERQFAGNKVDVVQTGTREEQRLTGYRTETQVVRAASTRTVEETFTVPACRVTVTGAATTAGVAALPGTTRVLTEAEYQQEVAKAGTR